jgi:hypothetical protein
VPYRTNALYARDADDDAFVRKPRMSTVSLATIAAVAGALVFIAGVVARPRMHKVPMRSASRWHVEAEQTFERDDPSGPSSELEPTVTFLGEVEGGSCSGCFTDQFHEWLRYRVVDGVLRGKSITVQYDYLIVGCDLPTNGTQLIVRASCFDEQCNGTRWGVSFPDGKEQAARGSGFVDASKHLRSP